MTRGGRRPDHHRHVEVILEQGRGRNRFLVAAVDQEHAVARERVKGDRRRRLGRDREQRCRFRAGAGGIPRPAGSLPDIDVSNLSACFLCDLSRHLGK